MKDITAIFGSMLFNDTAMKKHLSHEIYKALKRTLRDGRPLTREIADAVADAMKNWAIEKGATHFTHWFQPMTGVTAEKHDSFITPDGDGILMEFSGKELIKGEPDASSFPSGGLRATFEARGYTAWDPTSYAFIKDNTLCIPSAFCSYTGAVLDKKTPLLRSMEALNTQALRILRLFGQADVRRVNTTVGAEQEYFLIDKSVYDARPDLIYAGRTLFGALPPKGQDLDDHYFGVLSERVSRYMRDLDEELWKLGVLAKTEHNESAPAQHELAPIFTTTNVASDQNQVMMEMMKKVAERHGLVCLLHEKPFSGVNGSGKHNNWSMSTDAGLNLLEPGDSPSENAQFLLFLVAVLAAVDKHQDLLRISVASAGNDCRLGGNEAPPAVISVFLGDELTGILDCIDGETAYSKALCAEMNIGVDVLPRIPRDTTDRNRTSPFAFTGNKFEFRMLGSAFSIAGPNFVMNTIIAEELKIFADELENARNFTGSLNILIRDTIQRHKRIIFNGNNYSDEWIAEAEKRGLIHWKSAADALPNFNIQKNIDLFMRHGILTESKIESRQDIMMVNYTKVIRIEAMTMIEMIKRDILPAVLSYSAKLAEGALAKKQLDVDYSVEKGLCSRLSSLAASIQTHTAALESALAAAAKLTDNQSACIHYRQSVHRAMEQLRAIVDKTEPLVSAQHWPYPSYGEILFSVK